MTKKEKKVLSILEEATGRKFDSLEVAQKSISDTTAYVASKVAQKPYESFDEEMYLTKIAGLKLELAKTQARLIEKDKPSFGFQLNNND